MTSKKLSRLFWLVACVQISGLANAQQGKHLSDRTVKIAAGPEYKKSAFYQWLWGKNYRAEWTTPVDFPILNLDTVLGGLRPDEEGGGHQTTSLHLKTINDKRSYAARSVDKSLSKLLPPIFKNTFIDNIGSDQLSMSNPYGALAVPGMAKAAGIYHADPKYYYMPQQPALDTFNKKYGNRLYLFEEKPEDDTRGSNNFGNFEKYISSEKVMDKIQQNSEYRVDQKTFAKNRLFDMLIGDWDRHDKQWKWGVVDSGKITYYEPIPSDRDQAFSTYDGFLQKIAISATGMKYLKPFDYKLKEVQTFDYERRILDRWFTNELNLQDWQNAASELKNSLTDEIITNSIHQVPPEIFAIHGNTIIAKLKERRNHLSEYAEEYYKFLSREVEIPGTQTSDLFEIDRGDATTNVNIFKINKAGKSKDIPYYSRIFNNAETDEIRLFGLSGNDIYKISGEGRGPRIRIIGGDSEDSIINNTHRRRVDVYDDAENLITERGAHVRTHVIKDSVGHLFDFDTFRPDRKGLAPVAFYNEADRYFVGLAYTYLHHKWHKLPFASLQKLSVNYSLSQNAFSAFYYGVFPKLVGNLDVDLQGGYDAVRWINFFGLGNETTYLNKIKNFYQLRTKVGEAALGIGHLIGTQGFRLSAFFQSVVVISDTERYVAKTLTPRMPGIYNSKYFTGAEASYKFADVNDLAIPTKGLSLSLFGRYSHSLDPQLNDYEKFAATLDLYLPLSHKFSLAIRNGGGTVTGNPEFYQNIFVGGPNDLRGYIRERYWGKSGYYNSNELRFITDFRSHLMNGKIGFLVFGADGRVWVPGESSNVIHTAYGGGILIAPFNKILGDVTFAKSDDGNTVQLRIIKSL